MQADVFTDAEIAAWRQQVATAHHKCTFIGPVQWIQFLGGPLDGIRAVSLAVELRNQFIGWCRVYERLGQ